MEPNPPPTLVAKRLWHIVRVVYYMFRKGVSKRKLVTFDINLLLKRGKLASKKAIGNLLSHHHIIQNPTIRSHHTNQKSNEKEEEEEEEEEVGFASPLQLWTFGKSPLMVRQLRVTDSPFPMEEDEESDDRVDEEAEKFIVRFYKQLRRQQWMNEMEDGKFSYAEIDGAREEHI